MSSAAASAQEASLTADYKSEVNAGLSGSNANRALWLGALNVRSEWGQGKIIGIPGLSGAADLLVTHGVHPSDLHGDYSGTSNIAVGHSDSGYQASLYEAWLEYRSGRAALLAGVRDLNAEFYRTDAGAGLLNSAFGIGLEFAGSTPNGPSIFPAPNPSFRGRWDWSREFSTSAALSGVESGLSIFEAAWSPARARAALGAWTYLTKGVHGVYGTLESSLSSSLAAFGTVGVSFGADDTSTINWSATAGVWATSLLHRHGDLGFGVLGAGSVERGLELTYRAEIMPGFQIQPDLQTIFTNGSEDQVTTSWIGALRLAVAL